MVKRPSIRTSSNSFRRALEESEKRSQALQKKGAAARLVDKGRDSLKLIEQLQLVEEAIATITEARRISSYFT